MKQIFEWLREQIGDRKENCSSITMIDVNRVHNIIDEAEAKWEAEYKPYDVEKVVEQLRDDYVKNGGMFLYEEVLKTVRKCGVE